MYKLSPVKTQDRYGSFPYMTQDNLNDTTVYHLAKALLCNEYIIMIYHYIW